MWDKLVPKTPVVVSTVARPLSALRTTPPASVCLAVPALVAATSPSIPVLGVHAPPVPVVATLAVPSLGEGLLEPSKKDRPLCLGSNIGGN